MFVQGLTAQCISHPRSFARIAQACSGRSRVPRLRHGLCLDLLLILGPEHSVLGAHAAIESAVEFRAQGELVQVVVLLLSDGIALGDEALVLEALEAGVPALDFVGFGVVGGRRGGADVRGRD